MKSTFILIFLLTSTFVFAQFWSESGTDFTSQGSSYTKFQFAEHTWSGSHAILFNAYKSIGVNGGLGSTGNTMFANNQGAHGGGAGAIMFYGNGGTIEFLISPAAGINGANTNVNWGEAKMRILRNGEVGIGTTTYSTSGFKLSVAGKIRAEEIKVEASPWPDYVFSPEYNLKSLQEMEAFIKENKRLPDMPSAEEVAENGIALGEMNRLLLEKVEELTLHQIKLLDLVKLQNERIEKLENCLK